MKRLPTTNSIALSEKHGINPTIPRCFFCGKDKNEIILMGRLKGDAEAPKGVVFDHSPCDTCQGYMEKGIILISIDEEKTIDPQNPLRTGGWVVVKEEAVRRLPIEETSKQDLLLKRVAFVPDRDWDALGLPRTPRQIERL